jgi:CheY-like chemotaxis protein
MSLSVLIVDDNVPFLEAARRALESDGLRVVGVASSTVEAVIRHRALRPDVVLIDVNLGEESGIELARVLADEVTDPPSRVILISTYPEQDLVELLPGVGFLSKSRLSGTAVRDLIGRHGADGGGTP